MPETKKTLQQYLHDELARGVIDFRIRAHRAPTGVVRFYIHPAGVDGSTADFVVEGNQLTSLFCVSPRDPEVSDGA